MNELKYGLHKATLPKEFASKGQICALPHVVHGGLGHNCIPFSFYQKWIF